MRKSRQRRATCLTALTDISRFSRYAPYCEETAFYCGSGAIFFQESKNQNQYGSRLETVMTTVFLILEHILAGIVLLVKIESTGLRSRIGGSLTCQLLQYCRLRSTVQQSTVLQDFTVRLLCTCTRSQGINLLLERRNFTTQLVP